MKQWEETLLALGFKVTELLEVWTNEQVAWVPELAMRRFSELTSPDSGIFLSTTIQQLWPNHPKPLIEDSKEIRHEFLELCKFLPTLTPNDIRARKFRSIEDLIELLKNNFLQAPIENPSDKEDTRLTFIRNLRAQARLNRDCERSLYRDTIYDGADEIITYDWGTHRKRFLQFAMPHFKATNYFGPLQLEQIFQIKFSAAATSNLLNFLAQQEAILAAGHCCSNNRLINVFRWIPTASKPNPTCWQDLIQLCPLPYGPKGSGKLANLVSRPNILCSLNQKVNKEITQDLLWVSSRLRTTCQDVTPEHRFTSTSIYDERLISINYWGWKVGKYWLYVQLAESCFSKNMIGFLPKKTFKGKPGAVHVLSELSKHGWAIDQISFVATDEIAQPQIPNAASKSLHKVLVCTSGKKSVELNWLAQLCTSAAIKTVKVCRQKNLVNGLAFETFIQEGATNFWQTNKNPATPIKLQWDIGWTTTRTSTYTPSYKEPDGTLPSEARILVIPEGGIKWIGLLPPKH